MLVVAADRPLVSRPVGAAVFVKSRRYHPGSARRLALSGRDLLASCRRVALGERGEIRLFRSLGRADRIFCLVVDGVPGSPDPALQAFPPALLEPDPGSPERLPEPLAADVRPNQDRPADAKLKIIAGLLNVSFDDLRQREAARRQRQLIGVAAVSLTLMLVMLGLTIAAVIARNEAERQTLTATRTTDFLRSLFKISDPDEARGAQVTAREMLDRGVRELSTSTELRDQPGVRAELLTTLAEVYASLGLYRSAAELAGQAGAIPGQNQAARARQAIVVAQTALMNSDYDTGLRALDASLKRDDLDAADRIKLLLEQGELFKAMGRADDAERVLGEARAAALAQTPPNREAAVQALASLAGNDFESGNLGRAVTRLRQTVAQRTALSGPLHTEVQFALNTLGTVAIKRGDRVAAERYFRQTLDLQRKVMGDQHPHVAITRGNLARAMVEERKFADAALLVEQALATLRRSNDPTLDSLANLHDTLGLAYAGLGRTADAEASLAEALRVARFHGLAKEGEILVDRTEMRCATGRTQDFAGALDQAAAIYTRTEASDDWRLARLASVRGGCLLASGDTAAARPLILNNVRAIDVRWGRDSLFGIASHTLAARVGGKR